MSKRGGSCQGLARALHVFMETCIRKILHFLAENCVLSGAMVKP